MFQRLVTQQVNIYLTLLDFSLKIGELVKIDIFYVIHIFTTIKNVCLFVFNLRQKRSKKRREGRADFQFLVQFVRSSEVINSS